MKKLLALLLALAMIFALAACGDSAPAAPAADNGGEAPAGEKPAECRRSEKKSDRKGCNNCHNTRN